MALKARSTPAPFLTLKPKPRREPRYVGGPAVQYCDDLAARTCALCGLRQRGAHLMIRPPEQTAGGLRLPQVRAPARHPGRDGPLHPPPAHLAERGAPPERRAELSQSAALRRRRRRLYDQSGSAKAGRTIPIKLQHCDCHGTARSSNRRLRRLCCRKHRRLF